MEKDSTEVRRAAVTIGQCGLATNIWFFVLGPGNLHGIMPEKARNIVVRSTILADASTLVYHVMMPVGMARGSAGAISVPGGRMDVCIKEITCRSWIFLHKRVPGPTVNAQYF